MTVRSHARPSEACTGRDTHQIYYIYLPGFFQVSQYRIKRDSESTSSKSILFPIGLLFFVCCDFFVGLSVLATDFLILEEGSILYSLNNIGVNMAWVFYVPAQTLLALSVNEKRLYNGKKEKCKT